MAIRTYMRRNSTHMPFDVHAWTDSGAFMAFSARKKLLAVTPPPTKRLPAARIDVARAS